MQQGHILNASTFLFERKVANKLSQYFERIVANIQIIKISYYQNRLPVNTSGRKQTNRIWFSFGKRRVYRMTKVIYRVVELSRDIMHINILI